MSLFPLPEDLRKDGMRNEKRISDVVRHSDRDSNSIPTYQLREGPNPEYRTLNKRWERDLQADEKANPSVLLGCLPGEVSAFGINKPGLTFGVR